MNWTVGAKIGAGFGLGLLILIVVGIVSYRSTSNLTDTANWVAHTHQVREALSDLLQSLTDAETGARGYLITTDEGYLEPHRKGSAATKTQLDNLRLLTKDNLKQQERLDKVQSLVEQRLAALTEAMNLEKTKGHEAARQFILADTGRRQMESVRTAIGEMQDVEGALLADRTTDAQSSAQNARSVIVGGIGIAFVVLCLMSFLITQNISAPLKEITSTAERIAGGDLSVNVQTNHRRDEVGILSQTFSHMTLSLREMANVAGQIAGGDLRVKVKPQSSRDTLGNAFALMVGNLQRLTSDIAAGVNVLSASANQISTSTSQLAATSTETATAVAQTTTTVEEVRQTAQMSSQKSKAVSESAQRVANTAKNGQKSTDATIEGMHRIREHVSSIAQSMVRLNDQTQAVGQIIATVDDLAAQSNLLAVNAAIEAAKAGEQGKGFAVVAQEVRSLAEQSRQATNQVRAILSDIQKATTAAVLATEQGSKAVELGVKQSAEAGQSIQALSNSVLEAAQAATQIAASSQQQMVGVDQVAAAMESVKQASMQNVDSANQLATAAHNLKELGNTLAQTIEKYKV